MQISGKFKPLNFSSLLAPPLASGSLY